MRVEASANDIVATSRLTGVNANFLRPSLEAAGIDPDNAGQVGGDLGVAEGSKIWRDIWSAGHGVGAITDVPSARELCVRLERSEEQPCELQSLMRISYAGSCS